MEDGGYQLAMELEANSAWRPWLGEQLYSEFRMHLGSPATWAAFMKPSEMSRASPAHLRLQLKVRALLYDKALELPETSALSSQINPTCTILDVLDLQLKPDSVYFTLEQDALDWTRLLTEGSSSMAALQAKYGLDHRDVLSHHASDSMQQKLQPRKLPSITPKGRNGRGPEQSKVFGRVTSENARNDPDDENSQETDLWYDQWFNKRLSERMHRLARRLAQLKLPFTEQEAFKRTPEGMASFASSRSRARKRQQIYVADHELEREQDLSEADLGILPELTTISNCVPDNPCPMTAARCDGPGIKIEKLSSPANNGEPSLLSGLSRQLLSNGTGSKVKLSLEEAEASSRKAVGKILESQGFEGVRQIPLDILTEVMGVHIRKLGSWLRMLLDSYQKHLLPEELLRMFLQKLASHPARFDHSDSSVSSGNLRDLGEYVKNEKIRFSQTLQSENTVQQYQQVHSRQFTALQQSIYLENVLKKKQLPALRGNKMREELAGVPAYATMSKQTWVSPQMAHSQVLQQLKQQLQLPTIHQISTKAGPRVEGLQEILGNDVMKQETPDDLEGTLGSPNKRKRKDY